MTYPRRTNYRPSASLIHEVRMIAQSFFRHRTNQSIFGEPKAPKAVSMICVPCFRSGKRNEAVAIDGGRSVCLTHIPA